jgi:hypothetical protein
MTHADRRDRERWIASGLPDAVVTIMFRDGTLPPPHASRWYDSSLTTDEIVQFRRAGRPAPDPAVAASLEALGLPTDVEFVETWSGHDASTILAAIDRGFTSGEQFAPWADTDADVTEASALTAVVSAGVPPAKALRHLRAGRTPAEVGFARDAGIKVKQASDWIDHGMSATDAATWSAAGFSADRAAAWAQVADDPEVARLLESVGHDLATARDERPDGGWTIQVVRRRIAREAGAGDEHADEWASTPVPDHKLATWVASGVSPSAAAEWSARGVRPKEAARWSAAGFAPEDAEAWRSAGVDPAVAARRRDAGVTPIIGD